MKYSIPVVAVSVRINSPFEGIAKRTEAGDRSRDIESRTEAVVTAVAGVGRAVTAGTGVVGVGTVVARIVAVRDGYLPAVAVQRPVGGRSRDGDRESARRLSVVARVASEGTLPALATADADTLARPSSLRSAHRRLSISVIAGPFVWTE